MSEFGAKSVLVTGGTRGIGRAIARSFASEGAHVAICGRDSERAVAAAAEIADETGGAVHGFQADIAKQGDIDALVAAATKTCGPIQILVNNAGITKDGLLMRMKNEQWDEVIQTNLTGTFYACRAVSRDMIKARWLSHLRVFTLPHFRTYPRSINPALPSPTTPSASRAASAVSTAAVSASLARP